jgi:S1-C subfamily serine protease
MATTGIRINEVAARSAAAAAGLSPGDWIVGADGEPVAQLADLLRHLTGDNAGRALALKILRPSAGVLGAVHVVITPDVR